MIRLRDLINESPGAVISRAHNIRAKDTDSDAWTFGVYKGKTYAIKTGPEDFKNFEQGIHATLVGHIAVKLGYLKIDHSKDYDGKDEDEYLEKIIKVGSRNIKNEGRVWLNKKVISFWNYPKDRNQLYKIVKDLEKIIGKSLNDIRIEVPKDMKNDSHNYKGGDKNVDIIPLDQYKKPTVDTQRIAHVMSPMVKKSKKVKGFGSDKMAKQYGSTPIKNRFLKNKGIAENNDQ